MNRLRYSFLAPIGLASTLLVSGCGTGFVNAVTNTAPTTVSTPVTSHSDLNGIDMGGHAPLVGAHIYLVQLGAPAAQVAAANSPQTYGSVVKNLLTTAGTYASTYPLKTNSNDQFVPSTDLVGQPFQYVTTDAYGGFNLTGDYTCDPGYPVMLIGYGGAPSYGGVGLNAYAVSNVTVSNVSGSTATFVFTTTSTQLFYTGESITVSGITGLGTTTSVTGTVSATGLTTTQFTLTGATFTGGTPAVGTRAISGTATGTPVFNPAAVNMVVAGNCPTTGPANFGPGSTAAISYIFMNEVSTTAAGYALAGFTNTNATSQTGYDEFHIGAPVGNLVGIQNAATTAGLLYDFQGSSGLGTTPGNGESHVARTVTPNGGNGVVPQQLIDTIANALAACVDSANTLASQSTACKTLGQYAQDNGYLDTTSTTHQAANIAQAAFDLARFPQGAGTATTTAGVQTTTAGTATTAANFVSAIVNLPAGANTPYGPNYTTSTGLNDLAIGINWSTAGANGGTAKALGEIAADANGNIWMAESAGVYQLSPAGAYTVYTAASASGTNPGLAVAPNGTVYESATKGFQYFIPGTTTGTVVNSTGTNSGAGGGVDLTLDGSYIYQATNPTNFLSAAFNKYSTAGAEQTGFAVASNIPVFPIYPITDNANYCAYAGTYMTPDQLGNIWTNSSGNGFVTLIGYTNQICRLSATGAYGFSQNFLFFTTPHNIAIDNGNNAWFGDSGVGQVKKVTPANVLATTTGGTLSVPWGVAIDGNNTTWVANSGNGSILPFNNNRVAMTPTNLQGGAGFNTSGGAALNDFTNLAIDPSGNVWAAAVAEGYVVEYVGVAGPTTNPISLATANRTNGVLAGLTSSSITAYTISGNVVTFTGANSFYVGEQVLLGQFGTSTFFNGQTLTVTSATATTFKAAFTHANTSATETGLASAQN